MPLARRLVEARVAKWSLSQADYEAIKETLTCCSDIFLCKLLRATGIRIAEALGFAPALVEGDGPGLFIRAQRRKKEWDRVYYPSPARHVGRRDFDAVPFT